MSKAHSNKGRRFRFNSKEELERFVLLYEDLFTGYSEDVLKYKENYYDWSITDLKRGFERYTHNSLMVNLTKENLNEILKAGCFRKERLTRGIFVYVMK